MLGETTATLTGRVQGTPLLRYTPSGTPAARVVVVNTPRTYDHGQGCWRDQAPVEVHCTVGGAGARHVAESLADGVHVVATGSLTIRQDALHLDRARLAVDLDHHVAYVDDTLPAVMAGEAPGADSGAAGEAASLPVGYWASARGGMTWARRVPA